MTVDGSSDAPAAGQRRFQFGLRGLMVLAFAAAFGFSTVGTEHARWFHVPMAAAVALVILGLVHQICDLWRTFHRRGDLSADQRWGWRFAVFWRVAVGLLLAGYYSITILLERKVLSLPEREGDFYNTGASLRDAVFTLAALITFASIPRSTGKRPRWWRSRWITVLGIAAGACWCWLVWSDQLLITVRVFVAIQCIGMAEPAWLSREGFGGLPVAHAHALLCHSLLAAGAVLISLGLICRLARPRGRGFRRRWIIASLLAGSLTVTGACVVWLGKDGMPGVAPMLVESWGPGPLNVWGSALLLVIVFVTAATWRMVTIGDTPDHDLQLNWRRRPKAYYHERRGVLLLAVVGLIGFLVAWCSWLGGLPSRWPRGVLLYLEAMLTYLSVYLPLAVLVVVLQKTFTGWSRSYEPPPAAVPELPLARFSTVWIAMFLTVVLAVPTIAGLVFAVWLSPWHLLPWP